MKQTGKLLLSFGAGAGAAALLVSMWRSAPAPSGATPAAPATHAAPVVPNARAATPVAGPAAHDRAPVELDAVQARSVDVTDALAAYTPVAEELRVAASVVPDESRISHIHSRINGWVEKLYVSNTGEPVRAGQPVAGIYSQEVYASQAEYLAARRLEGPPTALLESGRMRLKFYGMSDGDIRAMEALGTPPRLTTLYAPRSGVLAHRGIVAGTAVDPSTEIAVVVDLSRVWVIADVPASSASLVRRGMAAQLQLGDQVRTAQVELVDPLLADATRTLKVRFSLPNGDGALRPGMYGTAAFRPAARSALTVPRDAVTDTGTSQYVYVHTAPGRYEPRVVRTGALLDDRIEIVQGLKAGEAVAGSGVFLLDSESRMRASGGQGGAHAGHGKAQGGAPVGAGNTAPAPTAPAGADVSGHRHD